MIRLPTIIDDAAEMNKVGIAHLVAGKVKLATTVFKQAIQLVATSISSVNTTTPTPSNPIPKGVGHHHHDNPDSEHQSINEGSIFMDQRILDDFETVPILGAPHRHDANEDKAFPSLFWCGSASMRFYNQAFVLHAPTPVPVPGHNATNTGKTNYCPQEDHDEEGQKCTEQDKVMTMCHSATLLFNLALTHQQAHQDEEEVIAVPGGRSGAATSHNRRRLENAIRLYNVIVDLVLDALSEEMRNGRLCWNLLIAALFNKACALCTLSRHDEARQLICSELADIMHHTTLRPPNFEDEHVDDLLMYSVLAGNHHQGISFAKYFAPAA